MAEKIKRTFASLNHKDHGEASYSEGESWAETISGEENLWFKAARDAEAGDYIKGALAYIDDALKNRGSSPSRSAISCSNAASCLVQVGLLDQAEKAYRIAGEFFMIHADKMIKRFPRETVWASNRAYLSFYLAGDKEKAEKAALQSAIVERTLSGSTQDLEINKLKTELETALNLQKKLEIAIYPLLGLFRVELAMGEGKRKKRIGGDVQTVTSELIEILEEKMKTLFSIFNEKVE